MTVSTLRLQHLEPENVIRFLGHPMHTHDVPHLIYVATGVAHLVVNDAPMTLRARESVWLASGVPHSARYEQGSLVLGPFLNVSDSPPISVLKLGVVPEIAAVMTTVLGVAPHSSAQVAVLRDAIGNVLRGVSSTYFALKTPSHPAVAPIARAAVRSTRTLAELASEQGLSVRHVQRVFQDETGMPFQRWRALARLNVAIAGMRGGQSVGQVARTAGYRTRSGLVKALEREVPADDIAGLLGRAKRPTGPSPSRG